MYLSSPGTRKHKGIWQPLCLSGLGFKLYGYILPRVAICANRAQPLPIEIGVLSGSASFHPFMHRRIAMQTTVSLCHAEAQQAIAAIYSDPRYIGWGGGVPVRINGQVVGAVAFSQFSVSSRDPRRGVRILPAVFADAWRIPFDVIWRSRFSAAPSYVGNA
jgi:hypothetical protein